MAEGASRRHRARGGPSPRWLAGVASALLVTLLVLGWAWRDARREAARLPVLRGALRVSGAEAPIHVLRDRTGIPHIRAESELDAWFGLGFVHAQDRPGQLLAARRAARGRAAEHEGEVALEADRWARTLGFALLAEATWEGLRDPERAVLSAYAAGVEAGLRLIRTGRVEPPPGERAPEDLDPWTPVDSLALLKHRAWTLGATIEESLILETLIRRLGPALARAFFPEPSGRVGALRIPLRPLQVAGWRDPLRLRAGHAGRGVGSSAVIVSARLARRRAPLLAADAHYAPQAPAELHHADLRGGPLAVAGAAVPGIPILWTGFNADVAWAASHLPAVVADVVVETLRDEGGAREVFDGDRWRPLEQRTETIRVRGGAPRTLVVETTPRGPLVHHLLASTVPLAVRWMGARTGPAVRGFLELAHASSVERGRAALSRHREPVLEVLLVDAEGGASQVVGAVPDRELPSGLVPHPSIHRGYRWRGALAFEALPSQRLGRHRPWLISADAPVGNGRVEMLWRSGVRARRTAQRLRELRAERALEERDLVALQKDERSERARVLVARVLELARETPPRSREAREVLSLLEGWSGGLAAGDARAAAYHVLLNRLLRHLFEPELGPPLLERLLALRGIEPAWLALLALEPPRDTAPLGAPWAAPDRVREAVQRSLRETWLELLVTLGPNRRKWGWGQLHRLRFASRGATGWRARRGLGPFPLGGDGTTLQVAEYPPLRSYEARVVAVQRLVADAGDLDQALVFLVPGQAEQANSQWRSDGVTRWLENRPALLSTRDPVIADGLVAELRLEPAP